MGALKTLVAAAFLSAAAPVAADSVETWRPFIKEASSRYGVPAVWIERVMRKESRGHRRFGGRPILSPAGAMGLMQLMPRTWLEMRALGGLGPDPFDAHDNILAGALYLRLLYQRFGYPGLFAAYNAGPARYLDYLSGQRPLPRETVRYLRDAAGVPAAVAAAPGASALFVKPGVRVEEWRWAAALPQFFAIRKGG